MRRSTIAALVMAAAVAACTATPPTGDAATCAGAFSRLESLEELNPSGGRPFGAVDLRQMEIARLRQYDCLTFSSDLADLEALAAQLGPRPAAAAGGSGRIAVQAGVVTNPADDARSRAFFEALGYRARSIGWSPLGRRILVEARSPEAVADIVAVAGQAGFVGSYPSRFVRF